MLSEVFKYLFLDGNIMQLSEWHELIKIIHKQLSSYVMSFVLGMRDIKMNRIQCFPQASPSQLGGGRQRVQPIPNR